MRKHHRSPPHPLLPLGSGFYALDNSRCEYSPMVLRTFLNQPHPIETLSNPTAYGSDGTILRDHDCNNYLKAVNGVSTFKDCFQDKEIKEATKNI